MVTVVDEDRQSNTERVDLILEETPSMLDAGMLDQIPEFIREDIDDGRKPQLDAKPMLPQASIEIVNNRISETGSNPVVSIRTERVTTGGETVDSPPADELEALWPGVHHELIQPSKRQPSFFLMLGFMAGAVVSLLSVWGYSAVATKIASADIGGKQIVVAGASKATQSPIDPPIEVKNIDPNATIVPISSTYEVKPGDTLVNIAMKNYKKVTPRLLDEIVKSNGMKSANVLSLGQKLTLPNYKPQASAIAATSAVQVH